VKRSAAVLDRVRGAVAVAAVHERGGGDAVRGARARHRRLLRRHRRHHLAPGTHPPTPAKRCVPFFTPLATFFIFGDVFVYILSFF